MQFGELSSQVMSEGMDVRLCARREVFQEISSLLVGVRAEQSAKGPSNRCDAYRVTDGSLSRRSAAVGRREEPVNLRTGFFLPNTTTRPCL